MTTPRCVALDMNGRQCRRKAVRTIDYHGDAELYGSFADRADPGWVRIPVCEKHSKSKMKKRKAKP